MPIALQKKSNLPFFQKTIFRLIFVKNVVYLKKYVSDLMIKKHYVPECILASSFG